MKKALYLACFLAIVSALAGGMLAYVNGITAPLINEQKIAAEKENLEKIFPGAEFKEVEFTDETGLITGAFEAVGKGYAYKATVTGYNNSTPIVMMVAFDNDGKIIGYEIVSNGETSGIGTKIAESSYKDTIIGKTSKDAIATISGATVSSNAVVKGINAAKTIFNNMKGIVADPNATAEPQKPSLSFGDKSGLDANFARYGAEVINEAADGDKVTYTVKVKGYGILEGDSAHYDYTNNEIEVVIDKAAKTVVSVKFSHFGDTVGIGDNVDSEEYMKLFEGASIEDKTQQFDTISGSTFTSKSVIAVVSAAIDAAGK